MRATFDTRPPLSSRPTISIAPLHDQYAVESFAPRTIKKTKYAKPPTLTLRRSQPSCGFDAHATSATESWTCLSELPRGWESLNIFPGAVTAAAPGAVAAAAPTGRFQQVSLWVASSNYELSIRLSGPQPLLPPSPPSSSSSARRLSFGRSCLSEGVNGTTPLPNEQTITTLINCNEPVFSCCGGVCILATDDRSGITSPRSTAAVQCTQP